jgi:hypothetical protein
MTNKRPSSPKQQLQRKRRWFSGNLRGVNNQTTIMANSIYVTDKEREILKNVIDNIEIFQKGYLDNNKELELKVPEHRCQCGKGAKYNYHDRWLCSKCIKNEDDFSFNHRQIKTPLNTNNMHLNLSTYIDNSIEVEHTVVKKRNGYAIKKDKSYLGTYLTDSSNKEWFYVIIEDYKVHIPLVDKIPTYVIAFNHNNTANVPTVVILTYLYKQHGQEFIDILQKTKKLAPLYNFIITNNICLTN